MTVQSKQAAPLYNDTIGRPTEKPKDAHSGLWFDRFFNRFTVTGDIWSVSSEDAKKDWINTVKGKVGSSSQLESFKARQMALVRQLKGQSQRYTSDWHFVSGMGNPHPVENGLSWHPTLAVPYLTGAAVKGLIRAWVELNEQELTKEAKNQRLKSWFGTVEKDEVAEQTGGFIFFDALPDQPPNLMCDIMTPHMGDWYAKGDEAEISNPKVIPADWHEPIPIPFLVVKQTQLVFSIAPRQGKPVGELKEVFNALTEALEWLGAGAKTGTGYGYFSLDASLEEEVKAISLEALTPEQQAIEKLRQELEGKIGAKQIETISGSLYFTLQNLIKTAKENNWPNEDKLALESLGHRIIEFMELKGKNKRKVDELVDSLGFGH